MSIRQRLRRIGYVVGSLVLLGGMGSMPASAATYYMAPTGSDAHPGTSAAAPWKTFAFAIPKLYPGDTLVLRNGTYTGATSGYPFINCNTTARDGTAAKPITLKAETERQALIAGTGTGTTFRMSYCSYWHLHGLHVRGADAQTSSSYIPDVIDIQDSSHLTLRRLLVHHNNRYYNNSLLLLLRTSQSVVEESEFYYFHRYAILTKYGTQNTFRRNYANSRGHADLPGGYASGMPAQGDAGIAIYPGSNHVMENNISEGNGAAVFFEAVGTTTNNRILGQLSLNDLYGVLPRARGASAATMPQNTMIQDLAVINPKYVGVYARSNKNTKCVNCSVFGGQQGLAAELYATYPGDGAPSFYADNALVVKTTSVGINMLSQASWHIDYPNAYTGKMNFNPKADVPQITNERTIDPGLGSCKVFIPAGSPMKGVGKGGKDIGANVLYRYQDSTLTTQPLWQNTTGKFPCGAVVAGVNDGPGTSCSGVHQRLNVNVNGCALPPSYGAQSLRVASPTNFHLLEMR